MAHPHINLDQDSLYFIPLGGSEQFGVNLNVYAYQEQLIAIDCGLGFADERFPGIDLLLPDPAFLEERADDLKALIITHAHEDHIGAVPHLWERLGCPIYATPFTAQVLRKKFEETSLKVPIHEIHPHDMIDLGAFKATFIPVAHSIPEAVSVVLETDEGRIVHSGDWNLDPNPVIGVPTDEAAFKAIGDKGVLAYIGDSTNAEVPGRAGSESEVEKGLEAVFKDCKGRIAVTIFSSNIGRIRSIAKAAEKCGRDVGVIGRSLHRMVGVAKHCGYLEDCPEFLSEEDLGFLPDERAVMICTGSQGEYRSALAKISRGDHRDVSLKAGDTVVFSSREIPGNERHLNEVKNNLTAAKINIITPRDTDHTIHVSGHPYRDEVIDMFGWVRPQTVIPVHGERQQLSAQAKLAQECQVPHTIVPCNGSVIKLAPGVPEIVDHVECGLLAVDQKRIINADHQSIVARRKLQYTGAVHASLVLDAKGELVGDPKIDMLGLIDHDSAEIQIEDNLFEEILSLLDDMSWDARMDDDDVQEKIRIGVRRFVSYILGIKPKVTIHVIRI